MWGHGHKDESWRIEKKVFNGDPRMPEMYGQLEAYLLSPMKRVDGAVLYPKAGGFDTGYYACMRQLYKWLAPRQRFLWYAFKGASQIDADPVSRAKKSRVSMVTLLMVGTHKIKSFIYNRANISNPGPGFMHFPTSMIDQDFNQLFAEESRSIFKSGVQYKEFSLPSTGNKRNEELDCAVMAHAALYARGHFNFDFEEKRNLKTIPEQNGEARGVKPQPRRIRRRQSNLVRSILGGGM
jgi:phage terminase large subunit GpA-like protein